jgi:hypothetical protein
MNKPKVLVLDDDLGLKQFYSNLSGDTAIDWDFVSSFDEFEKKLLNTPDMIVADIARFLDIERMRKLVHARPIIWASKFENIDLPDLPVKARILNKPFKETDLRLAIRSEFAKLKKRFDTF